MTGHSIGAFSAATISGALNYEDGLQLVNARGNAMEESYPSGYGMMVVIGLTIEILEKELKKFNDKMGEVKVTVPSHCELMLHVSKILGEKMNKMQLKLPSISYIMNTTARRTRDIAMISKDLIYGVLKPVYWYDNLSILYELGTRKFLKISQSNILTEMGEKYYPDVIWKKITI